MTGTASVERLCRRVAEIPLSLMGSMNPRDEGPVLHAEAFISDVALLRTGELLDASEAEYWRYIHKRDKRKRDARRRRVRTAVIAAWLVADDTFKGLTRERLLTLFEELATGLGGVVEPAHLVADADRREELVRTVLKIVGLAPAGESHEDAEDRLASLDSVKRVSLLREARAAEKARRAREKKLAAELAKKRAAEQAARYDREY